MLTWFEGVAAAVVDPELANPEVSASGVEALSTKTVVDPEVETAFEDVLRSVDMVLSEAATAEGMAAIAPRLRVDALAF